MIQRGRQSSAAVAVIGPHGVEAVKRPSPPRQLSDEEADEWRRVVNGMPADYFPAETHALLENRCRHVCSTRHLAQLIEQERASEDFCPDRYMKLLKVQAEQSKTIATLDTKMRLSQQTTHDRRTRKPSAIKRPWQTAEG